MNHKHFSSKLQLKKENVKDIKFLIKLIKLKSKKKGLHGFQKVPLKAGK